MEKALHDHFYVLKDRTKMIRYDKEYSSFLVEGANNHINELKDRPSKQIELDRFIYECMDEYFKNGASDNLLQKLNTNLAPMRNQCLIERSNKQLVAVHIAHLPHNPPPTIFAAYMFSNLTSLGGLDGLKRCQNPDCRRFFIGRSNVKWCSKTCGSLYRVRQKRKRDRD